MKLILTALISVALIGLWGIRVYTINSEAEKQQIEVYPVGTSVLTDDNYFFKENEILNGYSIKVVSSRLIDKDNYIEELGLSQNIEEYQEISAFYELKITVKNENNQNVDEEGLSFWNLKLVGDNFFYMMGMDDDDVYNTLNPSMVNQKSFSLRVGDEKEFTLPFEVAYRYNANYQNDSAPKLAISQYPVMNLLEIE